MHICNEGLEHFTLTKLTKADCVGAVQKFSIACSLSWGTCERQIKGIVKIDAADTKTAEIT